MPFDFIQEPKNYHSSAFIRSLTIISYSSYMFPSRVPLSTELLLSPTLCSHDHSLSGCPTFSLLKEMVLNAHEFVPSIFRASQYPMSSSSLSMCP